MNLLKLAWKNVVSQPLNLLLSVLLFALGIGLINFLLLVNDQLTEKFDKNLADIDMVIGAKGSPLQMILCNMYHIDNPTGNIKISEAKAFLNPKHPLLKTAIPLSLGDSYKTYRIVGTTHSILDLYSGSVAQGRLFNATGEVTIGSTVAELLGLKLGDQFSSSHGFMEDDNLAHDHSKLTIVGILAQTGSVLDQLILTSTHTIWEVHKHEEPTVVEEGNQDHDDHDHEGHDHSSAHVHTMDNDDLLQHPEEEITAILVQFKNRTNFQVLSMPRGINENTDMQAASPAYEINKLFSLIGVGTNAIRMLAFLIALVSMISIFITLYKSLQDRKYELALLRVSGASPIQLFIMILIEGLILGFIGYVIGILLSHVGFYLFSEHARESYRYSFDVFNFGTNEVYLLVISFALALVAALIPAIRAWNTDIHNTLSEN